MLRSLIIPVLKRRGARTRACRVRTLANAILILFAPAIAHAAVWPQQIGKNQLKSEQDVQITSDRPLWDEYGFVSATEADYGAFQATAYRFKDATDAFAAGQWIASSNPGTRVSGNYVLTCKGHCPKPDELAQIELPNKRRGDVPLAWIYLPAKGQIPRSGRYAVGPVGLQQFAPQIPAAVADFQVGTEVTTARYRTPKGEEQVILLTFPIPQMARQQMAELQKTLPGATIKRAGPIVAVVPDPHDPAAAETLLGQINYQAQMNIDEKPSVKVTAQGVASMVLSILKLAGVLILFCLFAGLSFALLKVVRKRLGHENADEAMIVLHLVDR